MNLFKALRLGNGKATFYEHRNVSYWFIAAGKLMHCHEGKISPAAAAEEVCLCTDWIPYVPCGTHINPIFTPYEAYFYCRLKLKEIGFSEKGIDDILKPPEGPPEKTKHKEVFGDVKWCAIPSYGAVYPTVKNTEGIRHLLNKPTMTMTLEWEE